MVDSAPRPAQRASSHRGRRVEGGLRNAPVGPQGGCPDVGPDTLTMKGQVDDELPGRGTVKGLRGAPDLDRAQHGDVDLRWWIRCYRIS